MFVCGTMEVIYHSLIYCVIFRFWFSISNVLIQFILIIIVTVISGMMFTVTSNPKSK